MFFFHRNPLSLSRNYDLLLRCCFRGSLNSFLTSSLEVPPSCWYRRRSDSIRAMKRGSDSKRESANLSSLPSISSLSPPHGRCPAHFFFPRLSSSLAGEMRREGRMSLIARVDRALLSAAAVSISSLFFFTLSLSWRCDPRAGNWAVPELCAFNELLSFLSPSLWPVSSLGRGAGLSRTARIERPLFHRGGSASTRDGPAPSSAPVFFSFSNLARRDSTGGAVLGAPTFLHFLPLLAGVLF